MADRLRSWHAPFRHPFPPIHAPLEDAERLPNSVGVLKLKDFKPVDLDERHKELLAKLADSYA